jgi:hypothetical protein
MVAGRTTGPSACFPGCWLYNPVDSKLREGDFMITMEQIASVILVIILLLFLAATFLPAIQERRTKKDK